MIRDNINRVLQYIGLARPNAATVVRGSSEYPDIYGVVEFYQYRVGVYVLCVVGGLPVQSGDCGGQFFGFHIHDGDSCTGDAADPLANAGSHYNPRTCSHPQHAGDLPPLLGSNRGDAVSLFYTDRFSVEEIIGKPVVIHRSPDDFTSQPSGNSGAKIACGIITRERADESYPMPLEDVEPVQR